MSMYFVYSLNIFLSQEIELPDILTFNIRVLFPAKFVTYHRLPIIIYLADDYREILKLVEKKSHKIR